MTKELSGSAMTAEESNPLGDCLDDKNNSFIRLRSIMV